MGKLQQRDPGEEDPGEGAGHDFRGTRGGEQGATEDRDDIGDRT